MPLYIIHYNKSLSFTAVSYLGAQVGWLRNLIGVPGGAVRQYVRYAGILDPVDASAEPALRLKCLLLVSVCMKQRSLRRATAMPASCVSTTCVALVMLQRNWRKNVSPAYGPSSPGTVTNDINNLFVCLATACMAGAKECSGCLQVAAAVAAACP